MSSPPPVQGVLLAEALERLRSVERSLCFGRIDGKGGQSWHIGRIGLRTESGEILLVDWLAEAAWPFHAATMASPMGLCRRRHLRVEDRQIAEISDEVFSGEALTAQDVIGDDPLVSAVSGTQTGRMCEAAVTLQREQDEIVRSEHRGTMAVDGGPGTGKTIVALNRSPYVLYAFLTVAARCSSSARTGDSSTTSPTCCPHSARTTRSSARRRHSPETP